MANSAQRALYLKDRTKQRREQWKRDHPCACGKPTASMIALDGRGHLPSAWNGSIERLHRELATREIGYFCEDCVAFLAAWRKEKSREARRRHAKAWREAHPIYGPPRPVGRPRVRKPRQPKAPRAVRAPKPPKEVKGPKLMPFSDSVYICELCEDRFPRHPLLSRHLKREHGVHQVQVA